MSYSSRIAFVLIFTRICRQTNMRGIKTVYQRTIRSQTRFLGWWTLAIDEIWLYSASLILANSNMWHFSQISLGFCVYWRQKRGAYTVISINDRPLLRKILIKIVPLLTFSQRQIVHNRAFRIASRPHKMWLKHFLIRWVLPQLRSEHRLTYLQRPMSQLLSSSKVWNVTKVAFVVVFTVLFVWLLIFIGCEIALWNQRVWALSTAVPFGLRAITFFVHGILSLHPLEDMRPIFPTSKGHHPIEVDVAAYIGRFTRGIDDTINFSDIPRLIIWQFLPSTNLPLCI